MLAAPIKRCAAVLGRFVPVPLKGSTKPALGVMPKKKSGKKKGGAEEDAASQTKNRLDAIMGEFQAFDTQMRVGTRQRRERDEHRLSQLQQDMAQVEKALDAEIKRRAEMNKSIQAWMEANVDAMCERFMEALETHLIRVDERIVAGQDRLAVLEAQFEQLQVDVPEDIQQRTAKITAELQRFDEAFEAEKVRRLAAEESILNRLANHEHEVASRFDKVRDARQKQFLSLRTKLDESARERMKRDERFQKYVQEEIANLRNALSQESQVREREDDELVEALNRYAEKLQSSLKLVNSTEC